MCDFTAVWVWLTVALVAVGGVVSSAIFGLAFIAPSPWQFLGVIGFFATAGWATLTGFFFVAMSQALASYCRCTARIQACADACADTGTVSKLLEAIAFFLSLIIPFALGAAASVNAILGFAVVGFALTLLGLAIALTVALVNVSRCQSTQSPAPPSPPTGAGAAPTG